MKFLYVFCALFGPLALVKLGYTLGTIMALPKTKGALFVSTSRRKIQRVLEELDLSRETKAVDLGCGDGRILRALWRRFGIQAVGYEINPWAFFLANLYNFLARCPAKVKRRDFLREDLSGYQVYFCYLFPDLLLELAPKLRKEAPKGALVVSFNFPLPGFSPFLILEEGDPIYFYRL